MILIVGLGNPGKEYELTRHNIGFRIVDRFAEDLERKSCYRKFNSSVIESSYNNHKIIILKPMTFMNCSGDSVNLCYRFFKDEISSILVVHDDIDIETGRIKLKKGGSTAGHRGLESIAERLGSFDFDRLRFGVGRPPGEKDAADYVLEEFNKSEKEEVSFAIQKAVDVIKDYISEGIEYAMNKYN
jgi:PTH1 family peptidyl-tRNA hydrolase